MDWWAGNPVDIPFGGTCICHRSVSIAAFQFNADWSDNFQKFCNPLSLHLGIFVESNTRPCVIYDWPSDHHAAGKILMVYLIDQGIATKDGPHGKITSHVNRPNLDWSSDRNSLVPGCHSQCHQCKRPCPPQCCAGKTGDPRGVMSLTWHDATPETQPEMRCVSEMKPIDLWKYHGYFQKSVREATQNYTETLPGVLPRCSKVGHNTPGIICMWFPSLVP